MGKKPFLKKASLYVLLTISGLLFNSNYSFGYVMPAEQILDFMANNFKGFQTVTCIQSTLQTVQGSEKVFTEQIWLKSPNQYSTKALDRLGERNIIVPDQQYRQLLVANSREDMERILLPLGIDLTKTSLTRLDGVIVYRIGSKEPGSPQLLVEKKRFLPLMLIYKIPEEADKTDSELITIMFEDYQKTEHGWYPYEITYMSGNDLVEKYTIQTFQANIPVDSAILKQFPEYELPEEPELAAEPETIDPEATDTDIDKERLKNVIKAFEEKYR